MQRGTDESDNGLTLDGGVRLLEKKLTLGGRMTWVGVAANHLGVAVDTGIIAPYQTGDYKIFDLYGSYAIDAERSASPSTI